MTPILGVLFFTSIIFEGGGTTIKSSLGHIWPAAVLIKMSSRSAFEEISLYCATAHILSAVVLASPYQYTVQRHKHSHQFEDTLKKEENQTVAVHIDFDSIGNQQVLWFVFYILQNSVSRVHTYLIMN